MSIETAVFAFAKEAPKIGNEKNLKDMFLRTLSHVGADKFACLYVGKGFTDNMSDRSFSNVPLNWQRTYLERGYDTTDPVFKSVRNRKSFGFWTELTRGARNDYKAEEVMRHAGQIGMHDGFTKRVQLDSGGVALVMIAGAEIHKSEDSRTALRIVSDIVANEAQRWIRPIARPARLVAAKTGATSGLPPTPAQLQVLSLREAGRFNLEISDELGISVKTVECHVTGAVRRLKARNVHDAVRIARERGLLN